jgi:hypothetical protein
MEATLCERVHSYTLGAFGPSAVTGLFAHLHSPELFSEASFAF